MKGAFLLFAVCSVLGCRTHPTEPEWVAGGEGSTRERAIVLRPPDIDTGLHARLDWRFKVRFPGWHEITNQFERVENKLYYTVFVTRGDETNRVWFDCTALELKD